MNNISKELATAIPIYTVVNINTVPLNPYREFVNYYVQHTYPIVEHSLDVSLDEFCKNFKELKDKFLGKLSEFMPNMTFDIKKETSHPRIFLEGTMMNGSNLVCTFIFYTHLNYINTKMVSEDEIASCEIDFTTNTELDFLNISKTDHIFDFNRDSNNTNTLDMIIAHLYGLANFTEFIKHFKTKSLVVKNIEMFSKKLIAPYVQDISIMYGTDEFIIGTLCGEDINKESFTYDNYLTSVKKYAETIKSIYGDKFFVENQENEKSNAEQA